MCSSLGYVSGSGIARSHGNSAQHFEDLLTVLQGGCTPSVPLAVPPAVWAGPPSRTPSPRAVAAHLVSILTPVDVKCGLVTVVCVSLMAGKMFGLSVCFFMSKTRMLMKDV